MLVRLALLCLAIVSVATAADRPNFVFILCDDLGYGDVKCNNPEGKIATPHMDAIAARGMRFTDAHSSSAVCSPTRYGVMTGRYNWRTKLQSGVLGGLSPRLIEEGRMTVAAMLKAQGYKTAAVGKWHLGMDWVKHAGKDVAELNIEAANQVNNVDFTKPATNTPTAVGFDYYFGISASLDMVPYCFIENDRVTELPTATMSLLMNATPGKNGTTREGPGVPGFKGEDVLPTLTKKAIEVIGKHAAAKENFFLYLPLNSPHTPILPSKEWQGKSGISLYADFVMQTDDAIGQIVKALEAGGIGDNTVVVVTSDNGCSPSADFKQLAEHGHNPSYVFRGNKADIFDGGHRVPFLVQWPAQVKGGTTYDHPVCLLDFMATAADITGTKIPDNAAEDSVSFLPALKGKNEPVREAIVHHSINGSFSIRQANWKLELCPDSGGWSDPRPGGGGKGKGKGKKGPATPAPALAPLQLYDLSQDIGEKTNVQAEHPEIVERLSKLLEKYVADGRSTPGAPQKNTVDPNIWKYSRK
ncbi:MAG: sulfatase-like hydrolase/transferase [Verrucomicrobiaceae bacterium]|nr:sulfatase-like hydrolase/transferase [Verrucomicrobiaceae bacterium]